MFNNTKSKEFFNPETLHKPVHIIGCGALGGPVAELLTRLGLSTIHIWDMDSVSAHNLGNQIYRTCDINKPKTEALSEILKEINPELEVKIHGEISPTDKINGYIFFCIDNIDVKRELCKAWQFNPNIKFIVEGRMALTEGQIHAADWMNAREQDNLIRSMEFTHEEAAAATPVTACGLSLSVVCTPRVIASLMVSNFIKFINTGKYERFTQVDAYAPFIDSYKAL